MGLWSRITLLFRSKTSAALDRIEDPRETMDYAYSQQQELLRKVRQGLVEVATSKQQLTQQTEKLRSRIPHLEDQARQALGAGREDLARIALERKQTALGELGELEGQIGEVAEEERKLTLAQQQLSARVEDLRARRTTMKAQYNAAEAQVRVSEALGGVSGEFADLGIALGRAEEKVERMRARASAIDALIEVGALASVVGGGAVERELEELAAKKAVEEELAALKAELDIAPGE